jgi:glucose/arabinose dehydrogenase
VGIRATRVFPQLSFQQPVALLPSPDGLRWYVVEKTGRILVLDAGDPGATPTVFADLENQVDARGEGGLLGMAFDPDFPGNGRVYLSYTTSDDPQGQNGDNFRSVVSFFPVMPGGQTLDIGNETPLLTLSQRASNHNGGNIAFGADGLLYIGFGDEGGGGDPYDNGQNTGNFHGTLLRIDVSGPDALRGIPYRIPTGNPFSANLNCDSGRCPEIYAWGFRNPWRWSFDDMTGALWLGDVGQGAWEEVDRVTVGRNYGWRCYEGDHAFNQTNCAEGDYEPPIAEYSHDFGQSITGGFVYRGTDMPSLNGTYVFGDFINGRIWGLFDAYGSTPSCAVLADTDLMISSFGQHNNGTLYIVDYMSGGLFRIDPA